MDSVFEEPRFDITFQVAGCCLGFRRLLFPLKATLPCSKKGLTSWTADSGLELNGYGLDLRVICQCIFAEFASEA
jgi:hypothetical protein